MHEILKNLSSNKNTLSLEQLIYLVSQFHRVIELLKQIQHNDIKETNIVVQINIEGKATPYIIDFGLAGDIEDNFLNSLGYEYWPLEIGAFILKNTKYDPTLKSDTRINWFVTLTNNSIRPYLFKGTYRDEWVQFLIDNKIIVSKQPGVVLSNNSDKIHNYLIEEMKAGLLAEGEKVRAGLEDFNEFRKRVFHKSDVFSLGIVFMKIYNNNIHNSDARVRKYLYLFKSMFLPMLYANVHLRPNWDEVERAFTSTVSVIELGGRKRSRSRKTRKTRKTRR